MTTLTTGTLAPNLIAFNAGDGQDTLNTTLDKTTPSPWAEILATTDLALHRTATT